MRPIDEWDGAYLEEVDKMLESDSLEKKESAGFDCSTDSTKAEIAKQVCAFANSGYGVLVYGLRNDQGGIDCGVQEMAGRQRLAEWAQALIPRQHHPPITTCRVAVVKHSTKHQPGYGALVIATEQSDLRPHWTLANEVAYIRVGAHSARMRPQTFLDIASRGSASPQGVIESLGIQAEPTLATNRRTFRLNPKVRVETGSVATQWLFGLKLPRDGGHFEKIPNNAVVNASFEVIFEGNLPLFPGARVPVGLNPFTMVYIFGNLTATLCVGSSKPVERVYTIADLMKEPKDNGP